MQLGLSSNQDRLLDAVCAKLASLKCGPEMAEDEIERGGRPHRPVATLREVTAVKILQRRQAIADGLGEGRALDALRLRREEWRRALPAQLPCVPNPRS